MADYNKSELADNGAKKYECVHCGDTVVQATPGLPFRNPECSNKFGHDYV